MNAEPLAARCRTLKEIAAYYGVGPKVVRRWLRQAGLPTWGTRRPPTRGSYYYTVAELQQIAAILGDRSRQTALFA